MSTEQRYKIINKFKEIGEQLVKKQGVCKECGQPKEEHALGYHNRENLVIFVNSIPTMTFTPLWCKGEYIDKNGETKKWKPLIQRE